MLPFSMRSSFLACRALLHAAGDAAGGAMQQARTAHAAVLMLQDVAAHLTQAPMCTLRLRPSMQAQHLALQRGLERTVGHLLHRVCCTFDAELFDAIVALHVVDFEAGAELATRVRHTFALLVTANDQYADGDEQHEPSLLQKLVVQDVLLGTYNKADIALAALFKEVPTVKFRAALETVLQRQFEWLQSYHAMHECVASWLQEAQVRVP